jgi:hypothetical protein
MEVHALLPRMTGVHFPSSVAEKCLVASVDTSRHIGAVWSRFFYDRKYSVKYVLIFRTLYIVLSFKTRRFRDWICRRPQVNKIRGGGPTLLGPLEKSRRFHWTTKCNLNLEYVLVAT